MKKRVLLTGAAGGVGHLLRTLLKDRFEFVCFDRVPTPGVPESLVGTLTDLPALERAAVGCDAVVHMGAHPNPADFMAVILPNNIIGTYNLLEAARRTGIKRVVLASSVQVEWGHPAESKVSVEMAPIPSNVYAASKSFLESIGHVYHRQYGMEIVCLRLGMVAALSKLNRLLAMGAIPSPSTLTAGDCAEIVARSIDTPGIGYAVLPAYSRNAAAIRDLSPLKEILGYEPQDDAMTMWHDVPRSRVPAWVRPAWWRWRSKYWLMRAKAVPGNVRRWKVRGRPIRRILVTGSAGYVGTAFRKWGAGRFEFVCFDRIPTPGVPDAHVGDLSDRAAVDRAMRGVDAVLHLGGFRDDADFMSVLLPSNVIGTWNVYAAAAAGGVRRVVFASSVQAEDGRPQGGMMSVTQPPRPTNLYAACKILGEDLGRSATARLGLPVIALRLGWVQMADDPEWRQREGREPSRITLTVRDACEIFARALTAPADLAFAVLPAYSRNAAAIKDLRPLKDALGYEPQDDAIEIHRRKLAPA